jgi:ABC-type sugar transport system permease subunit
MAGVLTSEEHRVESAGAEGTSKRRRRVKPLPYLLLLPALVALAAMLGFPLVRLVTLSL